MDGFKKKSHEAPRQQPVFHSGLHERWQVTVFSFFLSHLNPTTQGAENKSFTFPVFVFVVTLSSLYV